MGFTNLERAQAKIKGGPSLLFYGIGVAEVRGPELKTKGAKSFSFFLGKILHANFFFWARALRPPPGSVPVSSIVPIFARAKHNYQNTMVHYESPTAIDCPW